MSNADLIVLLGLGLVVTALALVLPGHPRATWLPMVLGVAGVVAGALAAVIVVAR